MSSAHGLHPPPQRPSNTSGRSSPSGGDLGTNQTNISIENFIPHRTAPLPPRPGYTQGGSSTGKPYSPTNHAGERMSIISRSAPSSAARQPPPPPPPPPKRSPGGKYL
jgi:hypothetical protein